ncbi:cysteine synthase [Streptacidiphilus pinicola]|uniref:Cysteine synthase n=1 Tax=Streptacidiphilus pinicola TaxID=2219663 RepID=A0A2X0IGN0_9ACTN|nr:pyridoxal-phosphate dependent enzyme [Streptacidiphilus pinicola]RAG84202.1 cysteine synthase [Streptacidiphilus pinicola]
MDEVRNVLTPVVDQLLKPFGQVAETELQSVTAIHERYPGIAKFRDQLGDTPLVEVPSTPGGATILAKCEWGNPAGSVKDRVAYALVCEAIRRHGDRPAEDLRLVEYSGGNLGLALSYLCAEAGIPLRLVVASFTSQSVLDTLQSRGTAVDIAPAEEGFLGTIRQAMRIADGDGGWQFLFQHVNAANLIMHQATTGTEIVKQLDGRKPHTWVAAIGTGGTLIGVLNMLRTVNPAVRAVGVTPAESPYGHGGAPAAPQGLCGTGGLGYGLKQPFVKAYENDVAAHQQVSYPEALEGAAEFFSLTGTRIGTSASANWLVARKIAAQLPPDEHVVTMFADAGNPEQWGAIGK